MYHMYYNNMCNMCFHTPVRLLRSSNTNRAHHLSDLLKSRTLCLHLCTPATVPILSVGISRLITSSKPFHPPGTSVFAPQMLTLCAFINFIYLLTCLLIVMRLTQLEQCWKNYVFVLSIHQCDLS